MTPEELAPAFKGRRHLAELWQKISNGATDFTAEEQIEIMVAEARVYQTRGDFPLALERGRIALKLAEERGYSNGVVAALETCAYTYYFSNNLDQAIHFAKRALEHSLDAPDSGAAFATLGACTFDMDDWTKAASYFEQATNLSRQLGQTWNLSRALLALSAASRSRPIQFVIGDTKRVSAIHARDRYPFRS